MAVNQTLTLTAVDGSRDVLNNTSKVRIQWISTQSGSSFNGVTRTANYWVSINGVEETEYTVSYNLPKNTAQVIVDTTVTIKHRTDGSADVVVRTWMNTRISAGVVELSEELELDAIPREAQLVSAPSFTDLETPTVSYINYAGNAADSLQLGISLNGEDIDIPYRDIGKEDTSFTFVMTGAEVDYLRSCATGQNAISVWWMLKTQIGDNLFLDIMTGSYRVALSDAVLPEITNISLVPVNDGASPGFSALYLQGKSKIQVNVTAEGKHGASITTCAVVIESVTYSGSEVLSGYLMRTGAAPVTATVTDSRGFSVSRTVIVDVIPYTGPKIAGVACYRAENGGIPKPDSTLIWLTATRVWQKIMQEDENINLCTMLWRYKQDSEAWTDQAWSVLLSAGDPETDSVSGFLDVVLPITGAYTIQICAVDSLGEEFSIDFDIPTDAVDVHLGMRCIGIGRYADKNAPNTMKIASDWTIFLGSETIEEVILSMAHPVGSILKTADESDPSLLLSGTWVSLGQETIEEETIYIWRRME